MQIAFFTLNASLLARWQDTFPDGEACLDWAALGRLGPAVVLVDLSQAGLPELAASSWRPLASQLRLVGCNAMPDDAQAIEALQAGFSGYCHAYADPDMLRQVAQVVGAGELWVGRSLLTRLLGAVNHRPAPPMRSETLELLSTREREVASLAARAASNKEIANSLDITERTVKAHLTAIFAKLGVTDRLQLALHLNGLR